MEKNNNKTSILSMIIFFVKGFRWMQNNACKMYKMWGILMTLNENDCFLFLMFSFCEKSIKSLNSSSSFKKLPAKKKIRKKFPVKFFFILKNCQEKQKKITRKNKSKDKNFKITVFWKKFSREKKYRKKYFLF